MKLLIQPGDGIKALVRAVRHAKKSLEIVIFRMDCQELELAMEEAAGRGVTVQALIAFTNRGGEKNLRKLETRLLGRGITVARTAGDLVRYHGKMLIVDRRELYVLAFNFTHLDIDQSRSFGVITTDAALVREAGRLFEADTLRQPYVADCARFIVSPVNARERLAEFIRGAKKQLLVYDVEVSDRPMLRLLEERRQAGVEVRIVGDVHGRGTKLQWRNLAHMRLHTRAMMRDRRDLFLGSQSMRPQELDSRREIGMILRSPRLAAAVAKVFEEDWEKSEPRGAEVLEAAAAVDPKALKKMARAIGKKMPEAPKLVEAVREIIAEQTEGPIDRQEMEDTVRSAVKEAVTDAVRHVVETVVEREVSARLEGQ